MSSFAHQMFEVNGPSGTPYSFRPEEGSFEGYHVAEVENTIRELGHNVLMSALEPRVVDVDSGTVVTEGVFKVLPALTRDELASFRQKGMRAEPLTHH